MNIQKSVVFLYTNNKKAKKEIKLSHSQDNKLLRNKLNQESQRSVQ